MAKLLDHAGGSQRLCEVVFPGSHDAGITSGGSNLKTQDKSIYEQACAGVRLFDLRVMAKTVDGVGGLKNVELTTYHSEGADKRTWGPRTSAEQKLRWHAGTGKLVDVKRTKIKRMGGWGLNLMSIISDCMHFFLTHPNEFLILKFDKCTNWDLIAETLIYYLDHWMPKGHRNINRMKLQDLAGKVIVLFHPTGQAASGYDHRDGIYTFKNLCAKGDDGYTFGDYDQFGCGLTYSGKGGTSVTKHMMTIKNKKQRKQKMGDNIKKQRAIHSAGADELDPEVLGMFYWTATGLTGNIEKRNKYMWTQSQQMKDLWGSIVFKSLFRQCIIKRISPTEYASGGVLKLYMPNIIMIDFASSDKCDEIFALNAATQATIVQSMQQLYDGYSELELDVMAQVYH